MLRCEGRGLNHHHPLRPPLHHRNCPWDSLRTQTRPRTVKIVAQTRAWKAHQPLLVVDTQLPPVPTANEQPWSPLMPLSSPSPLSLTITLQPLTISTPTVANSQTEHTMTPATVQFKGATKPPLILKGDITPSVAQQFEAYVLVFFVFKNIKPDVQVARIALGIFNPQGMAWYVKSCIHLNSLSFAGFMMEFHAHSLPTNWVKDMRAELANMQQGETVFVDFVDKVEYAHHLLDGTPEQLPESFLHYHIEGHLNEALKLCCKENGVGRKVTYKLWKEKVKEQDELRVMDKKKYKTWFDSFITDYNKKKKLLANRIDFHTECTSNTPPAARLPALTKHEKELLSKNDSCFKCPSVSDWLS